MKYICYASLLCIAAAAWAGCSKHSNGPASVMGRWNLAGDTTIYFIGIVSNYHSYAGVPGDYWDFRTDGKAYVKEGNTLDTLAYTVFPNDSIVIEKFGYIFNGIPLKNKIAVLTNHQLVIRTGGFVPPGGASTRVLDLRR